MATFYHPAHFVSRRWFGSGVRQICGEAGNNLSVPNISMSSFPHVSSGNPVVCALFYILDSRQKHSGMTPL
ncbi:MAG: hypothetical protein AAB300_00310, partial [Nitrospirota bacterium]